MRIFIAFYLVCSFTTQTASARTNETIQDLRFFNRTFHLNQEFVELCEKSWTIDVDGGGNCDLNYSNGENGVTHILDTTSSSVEHEFVDNNGNLAQVTILLNNRGISVWGVSDASSSFPYFKNELIAFVNRLNQKIETYSIDTRAPITYPLIVKNVDMGEPVAADRQYDFPVNTCINNWVSLPGPYVTETNQGALLSPIGRCKIQKYPDSKTAFNYFSYEPISFTAQGTRFYATTYAEDGSIVLQISPGNKNQKYADNYSVAYFIDSLNELQPLVLKFLNNNPERIVTIKNNDTPIVGLVKKSRIQFTANDSTCSSTWRAQVYGNVSEGRCYADKFQSAYQELKPRSAASKLNDEFESIFLNETRFDFGYYITAFNNDNLGKPDKLTYTLVLQMDAHKTQETRYSFFTPALETFLSKYSEEIYIDRLVFDPLE